MALEQDEYSKAFDEQTASPVEEEQVDITNQDEGAAPSDAAAEGPADMGAEAVVLGNGEAEAVGEMQPEDAVPAVATEAAAEGESVAEEMAEEAAVDEELSPEDLQRQKSWEGRLKKREEELSARESATAEPTEVTDGEVDEIRARLAEDFGEDFVGMILKLAAYEAKKMAGDSTTSSLAPLQQTVNEAIAAVQEAFQSQHFSAISEAHEDFSEVVNSPEFGAWVESLPEESKPKIQQVIEAGSPGQVIRMLNEYKVSLEQGDGLTDEEEAASGVRGSSPISLPTRAPTSGDDEYSRAWKDL